MSGHDVTNDDIAAILERVAELLEMSDANPFRLRSYRTAAEAIRSLDRPAAELLAEGGTAELRKLPGIGRRLAGSIREIAEAGRLLKNAGVDLDRHQRG